MTISVSGSNITVTRVKYWHIIFLTFAPLSSLQVHYPALDKSLSGFPLRSSIQCLFVCLQLTMRYSLKIHKLLSQMQ